MLYTVTVQRHIQRHLPRQKKIDVIEGDLMQDHVHMCLKNPSKYSVAFALGFMKGKNAVRIHLKAGYESIERQRGCISGPEDIVSVLWILIKKP